MANKPAVADQTLTTDLADRVERATGPDRALDGAIFRALKLDQPYRGSFHAWNDPVTHRVDDGMSMAAAIAGGCPEWRAAALYRVPAYTASLEAAIKLVPVGWWWSVGDCSVSADASVGPDVAYCDKATLIRFDDGIHRDLAAPSTPALALTAVSLRARAEIATLPQSSPC